MKKRVNPKAKALGFITDDDVFKELFA